MKQEEADLKKQVAKRKKEKAKKPDFQREESWRYKRVKSRWRKPRGLDSKMRKDTKGWPASPDSGYRGPKQTRGLHPSGFAEVRVFNVDDLNGIDPSREAVRIAHAVGTRKRTEIINRAKEMKIRVLNPREFKEFEEIPVEKTETKVEDKK